MNMGRSIVMAKTSQKYFKLTEMQYKLGFTEKRSK
jgi:hypothetical protein